MSRKELNLDRFIGATPEVTDTELLEFEKEFLAEYRTRLQSHLKQFRAYSAFTDELKEFALILYLHQIDFDLDDFLQTTEFKDFDYRLGMLSKEPLELQEYLKESTDFNGIFPVMTYLALGTIDKSIELILDPKNPTASKLGDDPYSIDNFVASADISEPTYTRSGTVSRVSIPKESDLPSNYAEIVEQVIDEVLEKSIAVQHGLRQTMEQLIDREYGKLQGIFEIELPDSSPFHEYSLGSIRGIASTLQLIQFNYFHKTKSIATLSDLQLVALSKHGIEPYKLLQERLGLPYELSPNNLMGSPIDLTSMNSELYDIMDGARFQTVLDTAQTQEESRFESTIDTPPNLEKALTQYIEGIPWLQGLISQNRRIQTLLNGIYSGNRIVTRYFDLINMTPEDREETINGLNATNMQVLQDLGIDLSVYCNGIEARSFDLKTFVASEKEIRERAAHEVRIATRNLAGLVESPRSFLSSIYHATGIGQVNGGSFQETLEGIVNVVTEDGDKMIRYIDAVANYIGSRSKVKDWEQANLHRHYLIGAKRLLSGESSVEGQQIFQLRHSKKDLIGDISLGYESGSCLAEDTIIPHLIDAASQFTEIYMGGRRVGLVLHFASVDSYGSPVLATNSIELSHIMRRFDRRSLGIIVDNTLAYVDEYYHESGFQKGRIGSHDYNTAVNYGRLARLKPEQDDSRVRKIGPYVFADILERRYSGQERTLNVVVKETIQLN